MALDFAALQTEVYARGLEYLDDGGAGQTRVKRWLNDALHEIDEAADWPYLTATTTGSAPLTIADLRTVECVTDVGNLNALEPVDRRVLREQFADLTQTGQPLYYFITGGTTINVYPANTSTTLTVDYWKFGPDLSADADEPLMPDRFRMAIVHYAAAAGLRDAGDLTGAADARQAGDGVVAGMAGSLLHPQHQRANVWVPAVGTDL